MNRPTAKFALDLALILFDHYGYDMPIIGYDNVGELYSLVWDKWPKNLSIYMAVPYKIEYEIFPDHRSWVVNARADSRTEPTLKEWKVPDDFDLPQEIHTFLSENFKHDDLETKTGGGSGTDTIGSEGSDVPDGSATEG